MLLIAWWFAQTTPDSGWSSPLAQYSLAGVVLAFVLWLFIDERREHRKLREKVLSDVLPALISNNEQMKESAAATVMVHQLLSRPNVDPVAFSEWVRTMHRVEQLLDERRPRSS